MSLVCRLRTLGTASLVLCACGQQRAVGPAPAAASAARSSGESSPASLLGGLAAWHLTLPTGDSEAATQVDAQQLTGYSDDYFKLGPQGDRVLFIDLFGGARTSARTAFARTELRQEYVGPDASENKAWPCSSSVHKLHVKQSVTVAPAHRPEMSIAQIHDAENDLLEVRYVGPGRLEARFNNDTNSQLLDAAYQLGQIMTLDIATDGAGKMLVSYVNSATGASQSVTQAFYAKVSGGCYFKAGNYHQACSKTDINGQPNAACASKNWPENRWETDAHGQSVLEVFELGVD